MLMLLLRAIAAFMLPLMPAAITLSLLSFLIDYFAFLSLFRALFFHAMMPRSFAAFSWRLYAAFRAP